MMSVAIGVVVGLALGLTGAGGSVFAVPLLMFALGLPLSEAAPIALLAVAAAAAFGTLVAWDVTHIRYRAALLMAATGLIAAPLGVIAAAHLATALLTAMFAAVLVTVALRLLAQSLRRPEETTVVRATVSGEGSPSTGPICGLHASSGRLLWNGPCAATLSGIGAVTGFLSGLLGVGGGFVIVPSLRASTPLSMHSAVATSLMAIALTSASTAMLTLAMGRPLPWAIAAPFVGGSLVGMLCGRRLAGRVAGPMLQQGFAVLMLFAAAALLIKSLGKT